MSLSGTRSRLLRGAWLRPLPVLLCPCGSVRRIDSQDRGRRSSEDRYELCYNSHVTRRSARFWFVYFLAWIPFAASYTNFFTSHAGLAFSKALSIAMLGVCPGALLGVGVVIACERLPWSPKRRIRLLAIHLLLAITYFAGWMAGLHPFIG